MRLFVEAERGVEKAQSHSLSGHERNRVFMQRDGDFDDVALVSGIDFKEDGRGFVLFDYDRDGWTDIGLISTNRPRFRILRNRLGQSNPNHKQIVLKLIGGNLEPEPTTELSARDPVGSIIMVTTGDITRRFEYDCGEGLSSQNSNEIRIGMGVEPLADLEVIWPSGKRTKRAGVKAGQSLTVSEK